jgi:hypothetical protein
MRTPRSAARLAKRIATGFPEPSPKVKVDPPAVVTRRFPTGISLSNAHRSNRSIGRLLPHQALNHAMPSTQLTSTGVERFLAALGRIRTKSLRHSNAHDLPELNGMEAEKGRTIRFFLSEDMKA